jgi:hypothetical protein
MFSLQPFSGKAIEPLKLNYPLTFMKFILIYDGPLSSSSNDQRVKQKQSIRNQFHPQLAELIKVHPALSEWIWSYTDALAGKVTGNIIKRGTNLSILPMGEHHIVPLFASDLSVTCHLDILFLRRSKPGGIIHAGGDLDNRLKTLFDALKAPLRIEDLGQIEEPLPKPFYCLLQDDDQISGFSVRTAQLLHPMNDISADVRLVIDVTVEVRHVTIANNSLIAD